MPEPWNIRTEFDATLSALAAGRDNGRRLLRKYTTVPDLNQRRLKDIAMLISVLDHIETAYTATATLGTRDNIGDEG